jgi:F-type H+-transporting ATPase subunit gamma
MRLFASGASSASVMTGTYEQVRGMATLKEIRMRLRSIQNISKITKSMKMISAVKYAKAERELRVARPFGRGARTFFDKLQLHAEPKTFPLVVPMTSDRGLCGAVHSNVVRAIRAYMHEDAERVEKVKIIGVGDKARAQMQRQFGANFLAHFVDIGKKPVTFADATVLADYFLNIGFSYPEALIYFNTFRTVVSYRTGTLSLFPLSVLKQSPNLTSYDGVDEHVIQCYNEFAYSALLFYVLKEAAASEQSSRMTAMDGATKNAGEMIQKLTMSFNRTRQAVITKELIEIISGAAAIKSNT